ncbi:MAG: response regulator [Lachnospiraceae bacterium]|nr:response regulator [Lachnospiraceae bacterium]
MERTKILIADDEEINRDILKFIFEEQYETIEAADGEEVIERIEEYKDSLAVIFLDLMMPKKTGFEVLSYMSEKGYIEFLPVIVITAEATAESDEKVYNYGAMDIVYKPFAPRVIMRRTMNIIDLFAYKADIEEKLQERTKELVDSQEKLKKNNEFLINALSSVVEFRSSESGEHIQRVKYFTQILLKYFMRNFPEYGITGDQSVHIVNASALHDLGKIAIPDNILMKPGKLTKQEFEEMKKHTIYGCDLLEKFKQEDDEFYQYCYDICRYHHERYDGGGYPEGLKGEEIPIWAQIVSLADVFDALVSKRVYKNAYATDTAIRMIEEGECGEFSPKILECFDLAKVEFGRVVELNEGFSFF